MYRREERDMAVAEKELENKKLEAVLKMTEMAQSGMRKQGLNGQQIRNMVGIKRYER
jgi:hypothetical protein